MTPTTIPSEPRWENYVLESGSNLIEFFRSHFSTPRDVCFILGKGFDPRMCSGIEALIQAGGKGRRDVITIEFDEGAASPSNAYQSFVERNLKQLQGLVSEKAISSRSVKMFSDDGRRTTSRSAEGLFTSIDEFKPYGDVVVDISSMPRGIYVPLIAKCLHLIDIGGKKNLNLHVIVSESPKLDRQIYDEGPDEAADYIHPFRGGSDREGAGRQPRVWIPILGEGQVVQLKRIYDLVVPDEIAPLMPSPSLDPRRGDDLAYEYRELLFDQLRVEPRNIIYASERNPFEAYRQLRQTIGAVLPREPDGRPFLRLPVHFSQPTRHYDKSARLRWPGLLDGPKATFQGPFSMVAGSEWTCRVAGKATSTARRNRRCWCGS